MRSVSHCGQTISLYTLHPTRCQRSYTNSTKREITSQRFVLFLFFLSSPYPLQMKSQWKGLSLTESCVLSWLPSVQLQSITETRQTLLLCLFLSTFPNLQLSQILYMGGTIIPGIAARWEKRGRTRERIGRLQSGDKERKTEREKKEREGEGERERSVIWLLGFICHHNSHITEMYSSIWRTKTTLPHYLFIPRPPKSKHFPPLRCSLGGTRTTSFSFSQVFWIVSCESCHC